MNIHPEKLALMVSLSGSKNFGDAILNIFPQNFGFVCCLGFKYNLIQSKLENILSSNIDIDQDRSIEEWVSNDYSIDPMFNFIRNNSTEIPSTHFLDIPNSTNNNSKKLKIVEKYYNPFEIGDEIAWTYRINDHLYSFNLYRHCESNQITAEQRLFLCNISNLMLQSMIQHSKLRNLEHIQNQNSFPKISDSHFEINSESNSNCNINEKIYNIKNLLHKFYNLTYRESEICAYIVLGYSSIAISLILEISINTIATHRKRAYSKLEISSQRELFTLVYSKQILLV